MSTQLSKVISLILSERFGTVVETVGSYIFKRGASQLIHIKNNVELSLSKIKEALCVLIKFDIVSFKPTRNPNSAIYILNPKNVILMLRYPKYISLIKNKFGDEAEIILEEILQAGYASASDVISKTYTRLEKDHNKTVPLAEIRDKFQSLVVAKYIKRISIHENTSESIPTIKSEDPNTYIMPQIDLGQLKGNLNGGQNLLSDAKIYWTLNADRFHQDMRDKLIVNAMARKFDENIAELIRLMLQQMYIRTEPWADVSNPVPIVEVKDLVKKMNAFPQLIAFFEQYVSVLENDCSQVITKAGEASGGSFHLPMKNIINLLTWEAIEHIVLEKFDSKAARIFRLVKTKQYIEPEQIQKLAMIPAKESKRLSYQLLEENFLQIQELKKSGTNSGPMKSFLLFHIQLDQVVRMVLELCYKALYNIITRRNNEKLVNKRLIDKKQRVDTISLSMKTQGASEEQLNDIEEMITPPERDMLLIIATTMKKLNTVELEIDDTMFLLELFLEYE